MRRIRIALCLCAAALPGVVRAQQTSQDATFGSVVTPVTQSGINFLLGGASDIVLDEARSRLYLVNPQQRRVEVYSTSQRRFLGVVQTDATPISGAMSPRGDVLYVTCYDGSALNVIDPDKLAVVNRVSLPAKPEGIAVGYDGTVLITTIGTGQNNRADVLLIYDPSPDAAANPLNNVIITPDPPPSPVLPPPSGRIAFSPRTNLIASQDGSLIFGFLAVTTTDRSLFVYEVKSRSILQSRRATNSTSTVMSVSPDGKKVMAGLRLFDAGTLQVLAQQNAANLPYTLPTGSNFNVQQNQGGSVFSPDGSILYTAFNFAPLQNPPARANVSQLMINDPDNMLVSGAFKLPENLSGNMVITRDGSTIYALSESGFMILPVSRVQESAIATVSAGVTFLANDQCGVTAGMQKATITVSNAGAGRVNATAQLVPNLGANANLPPVTGVGGIGTGGTGAGGGIPGGGGIIVVLPPTSTGATGTVTAQQDAIVQTAPSARSTPSGNGTIIEFTYNSLNSRSLGTIAPHDFQIVATSAINIPQQVRVYQNMRDADSRSTVVPVDVGPTGSEGLVDLVVDNARQRVYIANSGLNRVEVFDVKTQTFMKPIKVGQLPRSLAMTPDGYWLYVANSGGESISIIDLDKLQLTGRVKYPPLPFNSTVGIRVPSVIAATNAGLLVVMDDGSLWNISEDEATPRPISPIIGSSTVPGPRSLAATPNGELAILLAGNGFAYLFDANTNDFVLSRQVVAAPIQGYYGPIGAGPRGAYFIVNGMVLNQSLSIISSAGTVTAGTGRPGQSTTMSRPIAAVTPVGATTYARYAPPAQANTSVMASELPAVELVDINTGLVRGQAAYAVEGPLQAQVGATRVNINGRTMGVDSQGNTAYVLTTSGLSVVNLQAPAVTDRPVVSQNGVVSLASQTTPIGQGSPISIYGRNLGTEASSSDASMPSMMGGVCVTVGTRMLPLSMTSPAQINAQVPQDIAVGSYQVVVRNVVQKVASTAATFRVQKYAPAVLVDSKTGQASIYHDDGKLVTKDNPASRDDRLHIFAAGLGPVKNLRTNAGQPAPSTPVLDADPVKVYFDNPTIKESEMDVEETILMPGMVGVYRIQVYVPWYRRRGEKLLVTVRCGSVDSPSKGSAVPYISVN